MKNVCPCIDNRDKKRTLNWMEGGKCLKRDLPPLTVHIHAFSHQQASKNIQRRKILWGEMSSNIRKMFLLSHTVGHNMTTEDFIFFFCYDEMMMSSIRIGWESQEKKGHAWMFLICVLSCDGFLLYAHLSKA